MCCARASVGSARAAGHSAQLGDVIARWKRQSGSGVSPLIPLRAETALPLVSSAAFRVQSDASVEHRDGRALNIDSAGKGYILGLRAGGCAKSSAEC